MQGEKHTGGCLCGSVRYELAGDSVWTGYCHCNSCRKHTGAPVVAFVSYEPNRVRWLSGNRARYESSPGRFRAFCPECGTSLTWEGNVGGATWTEIHISTLDDPDRFPPTEHVFHGEKISWFEVRDELKRIEGTMY